MKHIFIAFLLIIAAYSPVTAQSSSAKANDAVEQQIIDLEKRWADALKRRDEAQMEEFLADSYFLAVGVQGQPVVVVPRKNWLENLKFYKIESLSIDDIKVNVYGDTAVVMMMWTQKAAVGKDGIDRSAQFVLTDIWVKQKNGWRVAERHSSRPEPVSATRPK